MMHALTILLLRLARTLTGATSASEASAKRSVHWGRYPENLADGRDARTHLRHL